MAIFMEENVERNRRISELRSLGYTIEEISLITGIPRSTVGYYVKKFKRYSDGRASKLEALKVEKSGSTSNDALASFLFKAIGFQGLMDRVKGLMERGEYEKLYYLIISVKYLMELGKYFKLTTEESKFHKEILRAFKAGELKMNLGEAGGQTPPFSGDETRKPRKSLKEIFQQGTENDEEQDRIG